MKVNYLLTATTGIAAHQLESETVHSIFKITNLTSCFISEYQAEKLRKKYKSLKFLVIDEGYRLNAETIKIIDFRLRMIKSSNEPFGNVTIITSGDPFQINQIDGEPLFSEFLEKAKLNPNFYIPLYRKVFFTSQFRTINSSDLYLLNKFRVGKIDVNDIENIHTPPDEALVITKTKDRANAYNQEKLDQNLEIQRFCVESLDHSLYKV